MGTLQDLTDEQLSLSVLLLKKVGNDNRPEAIEVLRRIVASVQEGGYPTSIPPEAIGAALARLCTLQYRIVEEDSTVRLLSDAEVLGRIASGFFR